LAKHRAVKENLAGRVEVHGGAPRKEMTARERLWRSEAVQMGSSDVQGDSGAWRKTNLVGME
jgi:hypothetical protein